MRYRIHIAALLSALSLFAGVPGTTLAQGFPTKPIRLLVGAAPGGGTDIMARLLAQKISEKTGQPVMVDNRPGANMMIATNVVAKSAPDGYTLIMAATPFVTNPSLYEKVPYDTLKDLTWVTQLTTASLVLVVNDSVRVNSVQELVALAKKEPGKLSYGSAGGGGSLHLAAVMLERSAGISMVHVPYKGMGPALTDLLGGRLQLMFADITQVAPYIKAGKVKALAVSTAKRSPGLPDVPTLAEAGIAGYEVPVWYGICGPAGMPADVTSALAKLFKESLNDPAVKQELAVWGVQPTGSTPAEFDAFARAEIAKWGRVIKEANVHID